MAGFDMEDIPPELLRALLDNPYKFQILVDKQGMVRFLSSYSYDIYSRTHAKVMGMHINDLNPESQLPRVLKSGKAEIGQFLRIRGKERLMARLPLCAANGEIIGAVGKLMAWRSYKIKKMARQLEVLESKLSYYE